MVSAFQLKYKTRDVVFFYVQTRIQQVGILAMLLPSSKNGGPAAT